MASYLCEITAEEPARTSSWNPELCRGERPGGWRESREEATGAKSVDKRRERGRELRDAEDQEASALSGRRVWTDSSSLPPLDYVSSSSLLTSSHVTQGSIQH